MPGFDLSGASLAEVVAFVRSIEAKTPDYISQSAPVAPLPFDSPGLREATGLRITGSSAAIATAPSRRFTRANVHKLAMRWMFTVPNGGVLQATPVVVAGIMYVTSVNSCYALDASTGKLLWQYRRDRTKGLAGDAAGGINRG
ncbi:MAG TPA: hypothetical protein VE621_17735 [Bryobacteraceae bacterium]|nr:hypothetical protein [Bryobacteraceae bacterium]